MYKHTDQRTGRIRAGLACLMCMAVLVSGLIVGARPAQADDPAPTFKLAVRGVGLRSAPRLTAPLGSWVTDEAAYVITARTFDKSWFKLAEPGTQTTGWILASLGTIKGDASVLPVEKLPVKKGTAAGAGKAADAIVKPSPFIIGITPSVRKQWQAGVKAGRRADLFTVVGDCNSEPSAYLWRLSAGSFDASKYPELARAVEQFTWSFTRGSSAAFSGFNSASMFDTGWSSPQLCQKTEGPLACELRRSNASIAFVALGTGDQFTWKDFPKHYRAIIDYLLQAHVLPVLVTKADDLESQQGGAAPGAINAAVRALGAEYDLPVIDFYAATRTLPDKGLRYEGNANFHMSPEGSDLRLLLTLQTLTAITSNVSK